MVRIFDLWMRRPPKINNKNLHFRQISLMYINNCGGGIDVWVLFCYICFEIFLLFYNFVLLFSLNYDSYDQNSSGVPKIYFYRRCFFQRYWVTTMAKTLCRSSFWQIFCKWCNYNYLLESVACLPCFSLPFSTAPNSPTGWEA